MMPCKNLDDQRASIERTEAKWLAAHPEATRKSERAMRWNREHQSLVNKRIRAIRKRNPDYMRNKMLLRSYGITLVERNALFDKQGGRCAICETSVFDGRGPQVDHDHLTGKVRGILCRRCNLILGSAGDNATVLKRAIEYLGEGGE